MYSDPARRDAWRKTARTSPIKGIHEWAQGASTTASFSGFVTYGRNGLEVWSDEKSVERYPLEWDRLRYSGELGAFIIAARVEDGAG